MPDLTRLRSLYETAGLYANPEEIAEAERLGAKLGAPSESVYPYLEQARISAKAPDFEAFSGRSPVTSALVSEPRVMAQTHDDLDALGSVETLVKNTIWDLATLGPFEALTYAFPEFFKDRRGLLGEARRALAKGALVDLPTMTMRNIRVLTGDAGGREQFPDGETFKKGIFTYAIDALRDYGERPEFQQGGIFKDTPLGEFTAGLESVPASLASGLPGMAVGGLLGFAGTAGLFHSVAEYDQFLEEVREQKGVSAMDDYQTEAIISAVSEGVFEIASDLLAGMVGKFGKPFTMGAVETLRGQIKEVLKTYVKVVSAEVPSEMATATVQSWARERAELDTLPPLQAAMRSILPTLGGATGFAGLVYHSRLQGEKKFDEVVQKVAEAAGATKLYQRNPELFREYVRTLNNEYGLLPKALYLHPEDLEPVLHGQVEEGAEPGAEVTKEGAALLEKAGITPEQYTDAKNAGTWLKLPMEDALVLYDSPLWEQFRPVLKPSPFRQDESLDDAVGAHIQKLFQNQRDLSEPAMAWRDTLADTLAQDEAQIKGQHGVTVKTYADTMARVIDAHARVWAEAMGGTPEDYWNEREFQVALTELSGGGLNQRAWHGSPHRFDRFTTQAIGTGEGAQAFGWGMYFSETEALAEWYREELSAHKNVKGAKYGYDDDSKVGISIYGDPLIRDEMTGSWVAEVDEPYDIEQDSPEYVALETLYKVEYNKDVAVAKIRDAISYAIQEAEEANKGVDEEYHEDPVVVLYGEEFDTKTAKSALSILESGEIESGTVYGQTYEVEIPDDADLMDWDRPLSEQPEGVREKLSRVLEVTREDILAILEQEGENNPYDPVAVSTLAAIERGDPVTGEELYEAISANVGARATSEYFLSLGIPGHRYLDGMSRNKGEGSYNYVIYHDDAVEITRTLYQGQEDAPRGALDAARLVREGKAFIELFKGRDVSTILHEVGHVLRHDLYVMATRVESPEWAKRDWTTITEWLGANPHAVNWTTDQEERFAEAFEQYVMDGMAPSAGLARVFHRFRKWMLRIYQGMRRAFNLKPEVREVFDRLLATQDEIDFYKRQLGVDPLLSGEDLDAQTLAEYVDLADEADRKAHERLAQKKSRERKKLEGSWRRQAREMADDEPVVQIRKRLREGAGISLAYMQATWGADVIRTIQRKSPGLIRKDPDALGADVYASELGFEDPDQLVLLLYEAPTKKEIVENYFQQIANEWDAAYSTDEALLGDEVLEIMDFELKELARQTEKYKPQTSRNLARYIRKQLERGRIEGLEDDFDALLGAIHREGKVAQAAMREAKQFGKKEAWQKAIEAKEKQRLNTIYLKERRSVRERREQIRKGINRLMKQKTIPLEYRERIAQFVEPFDLSPRTKTEIAKRQTFREWLQTVDQDSEEFIDIPEDALTLAEKIHPHEMTLEQLEEVWETVQHIAHLGKIKGRLLTQQERRDFEQTKSELIARISTYHKTERTIDPHSPPSARQRGAGGKLLEKGHRILSELRRAEFILDSFDGRTMGRGETRETGGPWWDVLFRPFYEAENAHLEWGEEIHNRLSEVFAPVQAWGRDFTNKKVAIEGVRHPWTRAEMVMVALNWGNEGNRDALRYGLGLMQPQQYKSRETIEREADEYIGRILDQLTQEEWTFVQQTWDLLDSMYPRINDTHEALTGKGLVRVEPSPVQTKYGVLRGGYFPLKFDREVSIRADENAAAQDAQAIMGPKVSKPATLHGHRKERVGGKMLPELNFSVISDHILQATHDAVYAPAVRDALKVLRDGDIRRAIVETHGESSYYELMAWLKHVANPRRPITSWHEKAMRSVRFNTTTALLGASWSIMVAQPISFTQTVHALGGGATAMKRMAQGFVALVSSPLETVDEIKKKSAQMRARATAWNRELMDMMGDLRPESGPLKRHWTKLRELAMYPITIGDYVGAFPSWLAAEQHAILDLGMTEEQAVAYADKIVRETQPASSPKDLAGIQRGGEYMKALTMFYGFFSVFYNRMYNTHAALFQRERLDVGFTDLAKAWIWMVLVPPLIMRLFKKGEPPDEEYLSGGYWKDLAGYLSGQFPIVRDFSNYVLTGFDYSMSPVESYFTTPGRLLRELGKGSDADAEKLAELTFKSGAFVAGLPYRQALITMQGAVDLINGETRNPLRLLYPEPRED